jgi:ketol-acid reductoisomerase
MRYSVSDTAEWGDYKSGPRIVTDETRAAMRQILKEIQSGAFAEEWMDEYKVNGAKQLLTTRKSEQNQQIELVGKELRKMMTFLNAKEVN